MEQVGTSSTHDEHYEPAASLEEGVPLLPKAKKKQSAKALAENGPVSFKSIRDTALEYGTSAPPNPVFGTSHNDKMLCYDQDSLLTVRSLLLIGKSAFVQTPVLYTLAYCTTLALCAAVAVFCIPKASKFDTQKFERFGTFLKFFIVFMLGIYVSQGFKRWWFTVTSFEKFLIAIRQMIFMLHTIRCTPESRKMVETYCVASGYILNAEVRNAQVVDAKHHHQGVENVLKWLVQNGMLTNEEVIQLSKGSGGSVLSITRAIWSWIAELISHPVVEEGVVVVPPLLLRCIVLCQACVGEIENLKMNITMQTPFMYAQLLAILVHVNNTLLSLMCGMSLGSSMNEIRRRHEQLVGERSTDHSDVTIMEQLYGAIQTTGLQLTIVLLTPMLYVAFLHIAHMLCYPFGDESYHMPTETLIARLHSELNQMSANRKFFKAKHKEWLENGQQLKKGDNKDDEFDDDCGCD